MVQLQVTSRSTLGAVALQTGGILIDRGWVRLLGSGSPQLRSTLASRNAIGNEPEIKRELWLLQQVYVRQLGAVPDGAQIRFEVED